MTTLGLIGSLFLGLRQIQTMEKQNDIARQAALQTIQLEAYREISSAAEKFRRAAEKNKAQAALSENDIKGGSFPKILKPEEEYDNLIEKVSVYRSILPQEATQPLEKLVISADRYSMCSGLIPTKGEMRKNGVTIIGCSHDLLDQTESEYRIQWEIASSKLRSLTLP